MASPLHFILCPFGTGGDVFPLLHLARLLRGRGHAVTMVSMDYFEAAIHAAGLDLEVFGNREEFDRVSANPDIWKPFKGTQMVFEIAMNAVEPVFAAIQRAAKRHPGLAATLVSPGTNFGARLARGTMKAPLITVHLQPISLLSAYDYPVLHHRLAWMRRLPLFVRKGLLRMPNPIDWMARSRLSATCRQQNADVPRSVVKEWWHSPDGNLILFPKEFAAPRPDWPANVFQHTFPLEDLAREQSLGDDLTRFLESGDKPVLFTPGTGNQHAKDYFATALDACQRSGRRAVFATRHLADVPLNLPSSVIALEYVPFSRVLPHCAALVHHGGIGTLSQALAAGIPQLIMPLAHDQPDNAVRIREQGLGDFLAPAQFQVPAVVRMMDRLLGDGGMKERCGVWADRLARPPSPQGLLEWMESLPHQEKPRYRKSCHP